MKLYDLCLAPVLLIGTLTVVELHTNVSKQTQHTAGNGYMVTALTCETDLGLGLKASTNGLHAVEATYGLQGKLGPFSGGIIPKLGVSYTSQPVKELPQGAQFSLGLQFLVGYEKIRVSLEYWHMSNGSALGLNISDKPNIGLDTISLQTGFAF
jgi:hypothetical protein